VPEEGEVERIKAGGGAETVLSLAASYLSAKNRGAVGEGGAHRGLRYDGAVQESEGGRRDAKRRKETQRDVKRCGGGRIRLYTWPSVGLADETGSDELYTLATAG
jgi:hypothetical protein